MNSAWKRSIAVLIAGAITIGVAAAAGAAGKHTAAHGGGQSSSGSSLSLVLIDSTDGAPHWGQQVTFDVSTTATDRPYVELDCYQQALVFSASAGFFADYPWPGDRSMTLSSNSWTGGAADCTATLFYWNSKRVRDLATLDFHVDA